MAIKITTRITDKDLTGHSHWWGAPDMPEGMAYPCIEVEDEDGGRYPEPLTFVCQIRCADIAGLDPEGLLPYFLGDDGSPLDYHDSPAVLYTEREEGLRPYELCWEGTDESVFRPVEEMLFSRAESPRGDGHILLGEPYQEEVRQAHPGCLSLLQIDEDDRWGLRFYDCGMYYFLIRPRDLRARRWGRVEGDMFFY